MKQLFIPVTVLILAFAVTACNGGTDDIPIPGVGDESDDAVEAPADEPEATAEPEPTLTPDATPTPDVQLTVDEVLERASERADDVESVRFELDGTGYIEIDEVGEVSLSNAEGSIQRPDRAEIKLDVELAAMDVPLTIISANGEIYFNDPVSGTWHSLPGDFEFDPGIIFDSDEGIPAFIRNIDDAEITGSDEVDGRDAYRIQGMVDRETINAGTSGMFRAEGDVDFEIWIDKETFDVLWLRAEDPTDETDSVWDMRIYDHNEPVDIEDPRNGDD